VENVKDPLKWWIANKHIYPNLSRMSLDFLSIPGMFSLSLSLFIHSQSLTRFAVATSTAVERYFRRADNFYHLLETVSILRLSVHCCVSVLGVAMI